MSSCIALDVKLIEETAGIKLDFGDGVVLALQVFAVVSEIEFKQFGLIVICGVMEDSVLLAVSNERQIEGQLLALEEELYLFQPLVRKHKLLLVFVLRHNYYTA